MIEVQDITLGYGGESVLSHFSCHIRRAELVCITGKSGCGKTSLLKAFIGLTPFTGSIRVGGAELSERTCDAIRNRTAYLPQELSFPAEFVREAIDQTLRLKRTRKSADTDARLRANMYKLGLDAELLDRRMAEISGGQRQRLMLATIALLDRELWLLDEPTAALDEASRDLVVDFLLEQQQRGTTIVTVSHDAEFAARCTAKIQLAP